MVADALSRSPLTEHHSSAQRELETDIKVHVFVIRVSWSSSDQKLEALRKATDEYVILSTLLVPALNNGEIK